MILGSRKLNSAETGLTLYNVAIVCCSRDKGEAIEDALKQCLDHVETAFYYDQSVSCSGTVCVMYSNNFSRLNEALIVGTYFTTHRWWSKTG